MPLAWRVDQLPVPSLRPAHLALGLMLPAPAGLRVHLPICVRSPLPLRCGRRVTHPVYARDLRLTPNPIVPVPPDPWRPALILPGTMPGGPPPVLLAEAGPGKSPEVAPPPELFPPAHQPHPQAILVPRESIAGSPGFSLAKAPGLVTSVSGSVIEAGAGGRLGRRSGSSPMTH